MNILEQEKLRTLPAWDRLTSDGCSALPVGPRAFRLRINNWLFRYFDGATAACEDHDEAYYYGGSQDDRRQADRVLDEAWRVSGVSRSIRFIGNRAIRSFGGPRAKLPGVSWAYGGSHFDYSEQPAKPNE